jgi:serine/threonine protein kinase
MPEPPLPPAPEGTPTAPPEPADLDTVAGLFPPPPAPVERPATAVGGRRFRPLRPLGKGGLGEVHVALDEELKREVALKEVQARHLDDPASVARFLREAEVTGRLEHPGVVPVYGLGVTPDGRPYYAMRLIRGQTLQQALDAFHRAPPTDETARGLAFRALLARFVAVCNAVAFAHSRGVVHRDLKPDNVMLGAYGETLVIDWGLAKVLTGPAETTDTADAPLRPSGVVAETQEGTVAGTPAYMSPEQAAGRVAEVGPASDVYALGAVLHAILTGRTRFDGPARSAGDHTPAPAALEAVCLKAMAVRPQERYAAACNAVAYAHSKGVLHRDLKPANVMLGPFGETLVIDWGLAKVTGEPAPGPDGPASALRLSPRGSGEATQDGTVAGTPAYMSPEQAAGRVADLGPAADVYSLGAILYALLTGRAPFTGAPWDILTDVCQGRLVPPRQVNPAAPAALEAVCLKAMALRPQERYAAATDLAADVERWLADEPVSAYPEPLRERLRRWARRHRTAVAGGAALLATATLALAVGLFLVNRERERTARALAAEADARARAEAAEKSASEQRALALGTLRDMAKDFDARLRDMSATQEVRKELLRRVEQGLKRVARAADTAGQIDHETVWVHLQLTDISLDLEIGGVEEAANHSRTAHHLARRRAEADPGSAAAQRDLSAALERLGNVRLQQGDTRGALAAFEESLAIDRRLVGAEPRSVEAQRDLAVALNKVGDARRELGDNKGALAAYEESLSLSRRLADADPGSVEAQRDLSIALNNVGQIRLWEGDVRGAVAAHEEALGIARRQSEAAPRSDRARHELAVCLDRIADARRRQGDHKGALSAYDEALGIARRLADADPRSAEARRGLAISLGNVGEVCLRRGDLRRALAACGEAVEIARRLADADPRSAEARRGLGASLAQLGEARLEQGDAWGALTAHEEALGIARQLAGDEPRNGRAQGALAEALGTVAEARLERGDARGALAASEEALGIRRRLAEADPGSARAQRGLAAALERVGDVRQRHGDGPGATSASEEALGIRRRLAEADRSDARACRDLVLGYSRLGQLAEQASDFRQAGSLFEKGLEASRRLARPEAAAEAQFLEAHLSFCRVADLALDDPTALRDVDMPPAVRELLLAAVNKALVRRKSPQKALAAADALAELPGVEAGYKAACAFALCVPLADTPAARETHALRSVTLLRQAVAAGYRDAARAEADPDLDAVRGRADFRRVLRDLKVMQARGDVR